ncbi:MAG: maleylpyruvate isomerase family mycothiol-dependent enzyme [Acidimicrobiales bacterium]
MQEIVGALEEQQAELAGLLDGLDSDGWATPSACAGWSIADVVLHLAQTNEMATGSARGDLPAVMERMTEGLRPATDVDDGAALMVEKERGAPAADVHQRWQASCGDLRAALLACDPSDRVLWVAGELAARTLGSTRLAETWLHTHDVADGLGVELVPGERLRHVARLAWRTIPYAFQRAGVEPPEPVAFRLTGPSGEPWHHGEDDAPVRVTGDGVELCLVAGQRLDAADTTLVAQGPRADEVLALVRTFA